MTGKNRKALKPAPMLDLEKLEHVRQTGGKIIARCPACREAGADRKGEHLAYWPETGKFACSAHAGDREHRREIWRLAGVREDERREPRRPSPAKLALRLQPRADERRRRAEERWRRSLADAAAKQAERVFSMDWTPAEAWEDSPVRLEADTPDRALMLERLFPPEAVVWTGDVRESGPGHEGRFRTRERWLATLEDAGPMICPDLFAPGSFSRSKASVTASPFLVVEADEALGRKPETEEERAENLRRNLCVIRWLREELRWRLRAVVHTGGKSCHGWFERPPEAHLRELRAIAPALGIDAGVFTPAHPVRLPGARHEKTGATARLVWLA